MYKTNALLDTGAVQSAMSDSELRKVTTAHAKTVLRELPAPSFQTQTPNVNLVKVTK